ncbi:hypothetical protein BV22DRAFT_1132191 [Leucogyrophana mollusca]|uniref:Uncharacterized protein n=1 Tax=Leucogyrophana mollusca TaxID=85980 RepID=A0ACB8B7D7_9AGAM|nr:hypothetical protein BV22DRAFT_1132191 [Leucogyrophana mollusca]
MEPRPPLITPSPSLPPQDRVQKRSRLTATPTPSSSSRPHTPSSDVHSARRESTLRVLNVWAQLAERYNKRLDEDDIIDLYTGAIINDRGVLRAAGRDRAFGTAVHAEEAQEGEEDSEQDQEREEGPDYDELDSLARQLRNVPPLSATTDAEDLTEFLEAEKRRREVGGEEAEGEDELSIEELAELRKALGKKPGVEPSDELSSEERNGEGLATPAAQLPIEEDEESEDELGIWEYDEACAVYRVTPDGEVAQDVFGGGVPEDPPDTEEEVKEVERQVAEEVIELTDSESDEEFAALLQRPERTRSRPPPVLEPAPSTPAPKKTSARSNSKTPVRPESSSPTPARKAVHRQVSSRKAQRIQLYTPPRSSSLIDQPVDATENSMEGRSEPWPPEDLSTSPSLKASTPSWKSVAPPVPTPAKPSTTKLKPKSDRKPKLIPEVVITQGAKRTKKREVVVTSDHEEAEVSISGDRGGEGEARIPSKTKGKGKALYEEEASSTSRPLGPGPRGTKRKRAASSSIQDNEGVGSADIKETQPEQKRLARGGLARDASPRPSSPPDQSHLNTDALCAPMPYYSPYSHQAYETPAREPFSHYRRHLPQASQPLTPLPPGPTYPTPAHPHPHASHIDPMQAQQAQFLLAQAMQQLSYIMSAALPAYSSPPTRTPSRAPTGAPHGPPHGTPNGAPSRPFHIASPTPSGQWVYQALPAQQAWGPGKVDASYSTHALHHHSPPASPSSLTTRPPPSPEQSPVTNINAQATSSSLARGRSKSRGRRVSFKLDNADSGLGHGDKRSDQKGKEKTKDKSEPDIHAGEENRGQAQRGCTPGPPSRDRSPPANLYVIRGRSRSVGKRREGSGTGERDTREGES